MTKKLLIFGNGLGMALDSSHFSLERALKDVWNNADFLTSEHKTLIEYCYKHDGPPQGEHELETLYQAITAYRRAWEILKQQKNSFGQAEITIDNLALTYAKQGELNKLQPFTQELETLAKPNNADHQLALHNIKINLARQLNDRQALLQAYAQAEQNLLPLLQGEQRFFYTVLGLRMHFNDDVAFEKSLQATKAAMLSKPALSTLNNLRIIKEISGILKQAIEKSDHAPI